MKRFFRFLSIFLFSLCILIFSAVFYGASSLPDEISISDTEKIDFGDFYFCESSDSVCTVSVGMNKTEYQSRITALKIVPVKDIKVNVTKRRFVAPSGDTFGIKLTMIANTAAMRITSGSYTFESSSTPVFSP